MARCYAVYPLVSLQRTTWDSIPSPPEKTMLKHLLLQVGVLRSRYLKKFNIDFLKMKEDFENFKEEMIFLLP